MGIVKNIIKVKPFLGSGPNTFINQWLAYKPDDVLGTVFWNTDFTNGIGIIPTFAATTGVLGILSWLLFFGYFIYLGFKSIFIKTNDLFVKYIISSSFFIALFLWVMCFTYVLSSVMFILTFFFTGIFFSSVYLSGIIKLNKYKFTEKPLVGFLSSFAIVSTIIAMLFLAWGLVMNFMSLWYFQKSYISLNTNGDAKSSEAYMLQAISKVKNDVYYRALSEIQLFKLNEILIQDPNKVDKALVQKQFNSVRSSATEAAQNAINTDPSNYLNYISMGRVWEALSSPQVTIAGSYEAAQTNYLKALEKNPKNPAILVMLAKLAVNHSDLKTAEKYTLDAISAKKNYLDAYFLLTQIEVASNNIKVAIDSTTAASIIDPTNPATFFQLGLLKYNVSDLNGAIQAFEKATSMTPDYANAKYFLGLSYELAKQHDKAIKQFEDLKVTNPDSVEVRDILANLKAGRPALYKAEEPKPEKGKKLPVKEVN
jgi:tetratricopeptide (TPR) repeat protein